VAVARTQPEVETPVTTMVSTPASCSNASRPVPAKPEAYCFSTTVSCGNGDNVIVKQARQTGGELITGANAVTGAHQDGAKMFQPGSKGHFEILASGNAAYGTGEWTFAYVEVYAFIALIYFVFVFSLSRYGAFLERRMSVGER